MGTGNVGEQLVQMEAIPIVSSSEVNQPPNPPQGSEEPAADS